jgi:hypothetical protein
MVTSKSKISVDSKIPSCYGNLRKPISRCFIFNIVMTNKNPELIARDNIDRQGKYKI